MFPIATFLTGNSELLDRVEPLWLELRAHHSAASFRFGEQLRSTSFADRRVGLIAKAPLGLLTILAIVDGKDVGYVVSSISADRQGDINSLFVQSDHRRSGIGQSLVRQSLDWFQSHSISSISVEVLVGNEAALPFYERFGFYPRTHRLRRIVPSP